MYTNHYVLKMAEEIARLDRKVAKLQVTNVRTATCGWKHQGEQYDYYETECDNAFELINGTPKENGMIYCPYCGKKIKEIVRMYNDCISSSSAECDG